MFFIKFQNLIPKTRFSGFTAAVRLKPLRFMRFKIKLIKKKIIKDN